MTKAHAQVTKKIWCEACKQGRLEVVKILISMTFMQNPEIKDSMLENGNPFSPLLDAENNQQVSKIMQSKKNPLGQYLRDFYEKMKGEKFDIDAWRQQSRKESDSDFVIETSKLHKIQIKSAESVEDSFKGYRVNRLFKVFGAS